MTVLGSPRTPGKSPALPSTGKQTKPFILQSKGEEIAEASPEGELFPLYLKQETQRCPFSLVGTVLPEEAKCQDGEASLSLPWEKDVVAQLPEQVWLPQPPANTWVIHTFSDWPSSPNTAPGYLLLLGL